MVLVFLIFLGVDCTGKASLAAQICDVDLPFFWARRLSHCGYATCCYADAEPGTCKGARCVGMELEDFAGALSKSKKMVKEVVMDQKTVRGIGKSYADEILWDAKISPFSIAYAIPKPKVKKLYESLGSLLKEAIQVISRENGDELRGELRDAMKVHGAQIQKSPTGAVIKSEKIGGRIAYYTDDQVVHN